jgi:cell division protein ZapA
MSIYAMKSIRVTLMGREYALRVREEDEAHTRTVARELNEQMEAFREAHPEQAELTTAIIIALGLADKLTVLQRETAARRAEQVDVLDDLARQLTEALEADVAPAEGGEAASGDESDNA